MLELNEYNLVKLNENSVELDEISNFIRKELAIYLSMSF